MLAKPRILIADDDPTLVDTMREALEEDFTVDTASDGSEALEKARRARPDLVMLDVTMPRMDGYASCRAMRQHAEIATVPIIMLTGRAAPTEATKAFEAGAADYLPKPFSISQLRARAQTCLMRGPSGD